MFSIPSQIFHPFGSGVWYTLNCKERRSPPAVWNILRNTVPGRCNRACRAQTISFAASASLSGRGNRPERSALCRSQNVLKPLTNSSSIEMAGLIYFSLSGTKQSYKTSLSFLSLFSLKQEPRRRRSVGAFCFLKDCQSAQAQDARLAAAVPHSYGLGSGLHILCHCFSLIKANKKAVSSKN